MPIRARTPEKCFDTFREHIAKLLANTLTKEPILCRRTQSPFYRTLSFAGKDPATVALSTERCGTVYLYIGQMLVADQVSDREYQLRTTEYWYRLFQNRGMRKDPMLRWEYDRAMPRDKPSPCRNHLHMATSACFDGGIELPLNELHMPTGWVLIENVVRFLIYDLGVKPLSADWAHRLWNSEEVFRHQFSGFTE